MAKFAFTCLLLYALVFSHATCSYVRTNTEKRGEVEKVWNNFPLYPEMQLISSASVTGFGNESITKKFRSAADPSKVKQFYLEKLTQDGWKLVRAEPETDNGAYELIFRKQDLDIAIEFAGRHADFGWDYGIGVGWTRWRKKQT